MKNWHKNMHANIAQKKIIGVLSQTREGKPKKKPFQWKWKTTKISQKKKTEIILSGLCKDYL